MELYSNLNEHIKESQEKLLETIDTHKKEKEELQQDFKQQQKEELLALEADLVTECNDKQKNMHKLLNDKYEQVVVEMNKQKDDQCVLYMNA